MEEKAKPIEAVIVDIEMPFGSMVVFLIKLAFAAIPAAFVIALGYAVMIGIFAAVVGHK